MMNENRVLLINCPNYDSDDKRRLRPLGICYLAASLRSNGIMCDILDANCKNEILTIPAILKEVAANNYIMIGISAVTPNFHHAVDLAQAIKSHFQTVVVLGGVHATFAHDKVINTYKCFDVIIRGEGEHAIVELVQDYIKNGHFTYPAHGCTYLNMNGKIHVASTTNCLASLDILPHPAQDNCFEYSHTLLNGRLLKNVSVISSRGCPYGCIFCSVTKLRRKWITRTAQDIASEVLSIYQKSQDIFLVFSDDNFYVNKQRAIDIIDEISATCGSTIPFCFSTRTDLIVRYGIEPLKYLHDHGCYSIELGVENGDDNVLHRMGKNNTSQQNMLALNMLSSVGINTGVDYILFDPWTTISEIKNNILFLKNANLWGYFPPLIYVRMLPYPGTKLSAIMGVEYHRFERLENYFEHLSTERVFDLVMAFKKMYQPRIDRLVNLLKAPTDGKRIKDLVLLRMLPYQFLEKAVEAISNPIDIYSKIIDELKIDLALERLDNQYIDKTQ